MILTLYSRPGCHLCETMKETVRPIAEAAGVAVAEIDISGDPALEACYGLEVPVLLLDGRKIAKYRVAGPDLTRMLERARLT